MKNADASHVGSSRAIKQPQSNGFKLPASLGRLDPVAQRRGGIADVAMAILGYGRVVEAAMAGGVMTVLLLETKTLPSLM